MVHIRTELLTQMREAVADCDDGSSDGSLMLLSPPRDIPEAELPAGSAMEIGTRDADSPVVMPRRVTPANLYNTWRPATWVPLHHNT